MILWNPIGRPVVPTMLFALASTVALIAAWSPSLPEPRLLPTPEQPSADGHAFYQTRQIPRPAGAAMVHASSLAALPNGDRLAWWYGGSGELAADVAIYQARFRNDAWEMAQPIATPEMVGRAEQRLIRRLGNPVAHRDASGRLRLFFVSVTIGGWATSSIHQMVSDDDGARWSAPQVIVTSPLLNLSTLVRHPPLPLADGGFLLPVYHELARYCPEVLRFDAHGCLVGKTRMPGTGACQPSLVAVNASEAVAHLRDTQTQRHCVLLQQTHDGGLTWSPPRCLDVPNPNAPVATGRLPDGTWLMVCNPLSFHRQCLLLARSTDGVDWRPVKMLEQAASEYVEFSYPALLVDGDRIDITYSWRRDHIQHVRFNRAWLKGQSDG